MRIADVMTPCPISIGVETGLKEAIKIMDFREVAHLPVVDKSGDLIGVLCERDARLSALMCESSGFCPTLDAICQKDPIVAGENEPVEEIVSEMYQTKRDCVLIADSQGNFVGIFTLMDTCRALCLVLAEEHRKEEQEEREFV